MLISLYLSCCFVNKNQCDGWKCNKMKMMDNNILILKMPETVYDNQNVWE